mmetsp:Transcript_32936/g.129307  ORF Transcript_32936/g.129307 Transcript_32936/m.129307 type:complete len:105 (+) Transcript_32936:1633-1947(+)
MYHITDSGLSSESTDLDPKRARSYGHYLQRPEAVEAQFYLWRQTKDPKYRAYAWRIFEVRVDVRQRLSREELFLTQLLHSGRTLVTLLRPFKSIPKSPGDTAAF